jgi:APA family basic amino acid/polyamine antiporter
MSVSTKLGLERRLGFLDTASMVVGAVIGTAIFLVPSAILQVNPSPLATMLLFLFAGTLSYFGALAYAELGAMMPATGGEYVYLRESWGSLWAFLCGWAYFAVTQTGGIAAIAAGFSALCGSIVPMTPWERKLLAAVMLIALTVVNVHGIRLGATVNNFLTFFKVVGLGAMIVAIAFRSGNIAVDWSLPRNWSFAQAGVALVPILWAYEGWNLVTATAGEIRDPQRNLPRALAMGLLAVVAVYSISVWVYLKALPVPAIAGSQAVAADAAIRVLGPVGGTLVTATMLTAIAGSLNACILTAPRIYFAQALDGLFFARFGRVQPEHHTPYVALWAQCAWAVALVLTGSYEALLSYCTFGAWIFYALAVSGVIVLRRRRPLTERPFRMWGYPWTALAFTAAAVAFVLSTLIQYPVTSAAGVGLIATGIPLYLYWKRKRQEPLPQ